MIRGGAKKEGIFGLSDIDLVIIYFSGEDDFRTISQIKNVLSRLRFIFRGLIASSKEIVILTKEGFEKYSSDRYLYAYRLAEGFLTWKLLLGKDILSDLKRDNTIESMQLSILSEINLCWDLLLNSYNLNKTLPQFMINYRSYKGAIEMCRIYLLVCHGVMTRSRMEALEVMDDCGKNLGWGEIKKQLISSYQNRFFGHWDNSDEMMAFIRNIVREVYKKIEDLPSNSKSIKKVSFNTSFGIDDFLPQKNLLNIKDQIMNFSQKWVHELKGVSLIPQVEFKYNNLELDDYYNRLSFKQAFEMPEFFLTNLSNAEFYPVYLVIHSDHELSKEFMQELLLYIDKLRVFIEIYPYQLKGKLAYPLIKNYKEDIKQIKSPLADPVFFYCLAQVSFRIFGESAPPSNEGIMMSLVAANESLRFLEYFEPQLKKHSLVKTCVPGFWRFFLTVIRSRIFLKTSSLNLVNICVLPDEIFEYLFQEYPQYKVWLQCFYEQIQLNRQEVYSDSPLYFSKLLGILKNEKIEESLLSSNLSVSVIVITADRKKEIVDCLNSLLVQSRIPDEIVIVDNGEDEFVDDVIGDYVKDLNIKYIREKKQGIPMARNAGLKLAVGDIIVFIDDDCVADRQWLEKLIIPFLEDKSIGVVGGYLSGLGRTNRIIERYYDFTLSTKFGFEN